MKLTQGIVSSFYAIKGFASQQQSGLGCLLKVVKE